MFAAVVRDEVRSPRRPQARRQVPAQHGLERGGSLEAPARLHEALHREERHRVLHGQRCGNRQGARPRRPLQHGHAVRVLQAREHHSDRDGCQVPQGCCRHIVRQEGSKDCRHEQRRHRQGHRGSASRQCSCGLGEC